MYPICSIRRGQIIIDREECDMDADDLMMMALDAGAEDFLRGRGQLRDSYFPDDFSKVRETLEKEGIRWLRLRIT